MNLASLASPSAGAAGGRSPEVFHSYARAMCPLCRELVDGARILRDGKVFLRKFCPRHGESEALLSGEAAWFLRSHAFIREGWVPLAHSTRVKDGCPRDCGLCPDHEQHSCLPVIEVTNHCDLACPICLVQNRSNYEMTREEFAGIVDGLVAKEGTLDTVNLSGGEPTLHPAILDLLDLAKRPEISRVSISTNGLRIADDLDLCRELAERGVYVNLQFDALGDHELERLRGKGGLSDRKLRALDNLERAGVRTTLVSTVARGVNDDRAGECVKLFLERDFLLSLMFQPAAYTGDGGGCFEPRDPLDRITIPDIIRRIEEQTGGVLAKTDFLPLPCSHPSCFALTYLLKTGSGFVPFPRFIDLERYLDLLANRGTIRPDEQFEGTIRATIDELWSSAGQIPDAPRILGTLKRTLVLLYPEERVLELEERTRAGEGLVKSIFLHAFMDEMSFELDRVKKCCTHYALPDGRLMPACAYNLFHRRADPRFAGTGAKGA